MSSIQLDLSFANLYRQYRRCRSNKRNTVNALRFEAEQEKQMIQLQQELESRTYQPGRSVYFFATRPKLREIFAADFRDRVVHHLLVDYLEGIWEPIFIHDSYACRKNKGVHAGVKRLQTFLRQVTANGSRPAWYLQLDVHNYFMRIDKRILFSLLEKHVKDKTALWLTRLLVFHDCTQNYQLKGNPVLVQAIAPHKTLFNAPPGKGLPIGNLNSQFFANVYLNELDQFVKHTLKCHHYLRYCDDFVLLSYEQAQLLEWREKIELFLHDRLALSLNKKQRLAPVSNGIDFLGYIVRRDYLLVRRRVINHLKEKLLSCEKQLVTVKNGVRCYRYDESLLDALHAMLSSYLGHFKLANSWCFQQSLWREYGYIANYFEWDANFDKLVRKYKVPKGFGRVRQQYYWFRWRFAGDVLLFRVGRFYEFYHSSDRDVARTLGLKQMRANRRGARYGFPAIHRSRYLDQLVNAGVSVCVIEQAEALSSGVVSRIPYKRLAHVGK